MEIFAVHGYERIATELEFCKTKLDKESTYVESTWNRFTKAIEEAEKYVAMNKGDLILSVDVDELDNITVNIVSQADVNEVYYELVAAREGLMNKSQMPSYLQKAVLDAEKFIDSNTALYFDEYWNAFMGAYINAKNLLDDPDLFDKESDYINGYILALNNALTALKEDHDTRGGYIYTASDFAKLDGQKGTFFLMADITVSAPLESFHGILAGNGHTITLDGCALFNNLKGETEVDSEEEPIAYIVQLNIVGDAGGAKSIFGKADGRMELAYLNIEVSSVSDAAIFDSAETDSAIRVRNVITKTDAKYAIFGDINCDAEIVNCLAMCKAEALFGKLNRFMVRNAYLDGVEYYTDSASPVRKIDAETFASGEVAYNVNNGFGKILLVQNLGADALPKLGKVLVDESNLVVFVDGEYVNKGVKVDLGDIPSYVPVAPTAPNYADINAAIARAEALAEELYTAESWAALKTAVENAKAALSATSQDVIDQAFNALTMATVSLDKKVAEIPAVEVDYAALNELITAVKALKEADYTEATWATLKNMLAMAEAALTAKDQATVNSAKSALALAQINLEKVAAKEEPKDDKPAATEPAGEEEGCGSVIGGAAVVLTAVLALGAGVSFKKKED